MSNYSKVKNVVDQIQKEIQNLVYQKTGQYCNIQINPDYDNVIGGYNFQVFATNVVNRHIVLDKSKISNFKETLKEVKGIKRVKMSPAYNQKMLTVFSVGLDKKLLK